MTSTTTPTTKEKCPICRFDCPKPAWGLNATRCYFDCPVCGQYGIDRMAMAIARQREYATPPDLISGVTRHVWEGTRQPFVISAGMLESVDALLKAAPVTVPRADDVLAKSDLILAYIRRRSDSPGCVVDLHAADRSIGFCRDRREFNYHLDFIKKRGLIETIKGEDRTPFSCRITPEGWIYLSGVGADKPDQAFVAMSFKDELTPLWHDGIKIGIRAAGYTPLRIDDKEHTNRIDDEIIAEIRKSRFIVADLTGNNAGAHFEAGFALGLGKPVIWTCKQEDVEAKAVHFDTRQYSIVTWTDDIPDFTRRLSLRIQATLGTGPLSTDQQALTTVQSGGN